MINKEKARSLVLEKILNDWNIENDEPVILDEYTIEKDYGWLFFYNSRRFLETEEFKYMIAGNAPMIVNKHHSSLHITGTARETEYYIADYENNLMNQI
jgi:hypothetical protein